MLDLQEINGGEINDPAGLRDHIIRTGKKTGIGSYEISWMWGGTQEYQDLRLKLATGAAIIHLTKIDKIQTARDIFWECLTKQASAGEQFPCTLLTVAAESKEFQRLIDKELMSTIEDKELPKASQDNGHPDDPGL